MSDLLHMISLDWKNGLLFIAAIIIVGVFIIQRFDWLVEKLGIKSKRQLAEEKQDEDIGELKNHANKTDKNIDDIIRRLEDMQKSIDKLYDKVEDMQRRTDENEAARIKDRVAQAYRYYHQRGELTKMEKEALEENIKAYGQYSDNSFIHSVVEKELPSWRVIDE